MKHTDIFVALAAPFKPTEVKTRVGTGGKSFKYVTARTVMNRLDDVLGPENWWDAYPQIGTNSVVCALTIRLPDDQIITKHDAGGFAGMADSGDDDKSGFSDAFKRTAVKFGVGRYLYGDGVPTYGAQGSQNSAPAQSGNGSQPAAGTVAAPPARQPSWDNFRLPRAGKAVYAWAKFHESHFGVDILTPMREYGENLGCGDNFVTWTQDEANQICLLVVKYLTGLDHYKGEFTGKVDVSKVDTDAVATSREDQRLLKVTLVEKLKEIVQKTGRDPGDNTEVRKILDTISAAAVNYSGACGEVLQSLKDCRDSVWIRNMIVQAEQELAAVPNLEPEEALLDDDIPF